jgi:predicted RNase H-like HicB family nuclease
MPILERGESTESTVASAVMVRTGGFTLWTRDFSPEPGGYVATKYIPQTLLSRYLRAALKGLEFRQFEDGSWYAQLPGFPGVWANEETLPDCMKTLEEVLVDWIFLKLDGEDKDIPVIDGIDLNVIQ